MQFSFKSIVRLALPLLCAGVFIFSPSVSLCMEDYEPSRKFQPRLVSAQREIFEFLKNEEHPLGKRLDFAFNFLQGEEGTLQQRKGICEIVRPFVRREKGLFEEGIYLTAAEIMVDHGTSEERKLVCEHLFLIFNEREIPLKERVGAARILSQAGTLSQRKRACQFLEACVKEEATSLEECFLAAETLYEQGTDTQKNLVFAALKELITHKKGNVSLEVLMDAAESITQNGMTLEQREYGAEILTEGLEKDNFLISKDMHEMTEVGFEGTVFYYGTTSQKDRVRQVLLSIFRDEKRDLQERLRVVRSLSMGHSGEYVEETDKILGEVVSIFETTSPLLLPLEKRIDVSRHFLSMYALNSDIRKKEISFFLKVAEDKTLSVEERMKAAEGIVQASQEKEREVAKGIIISLVEEFSILPLDSFCSFYFRNNMFNGIEDKDKKSSLGKSLLSILENNELSLSPVVRVRFLTLFSSPGALSEHQIRANFLLQSFLQEENKSLFLEKSVIVAASILAQVGDSSQKFYGLKILKSLFENEDVLLENRLEALDAFMKSGTLDQQEEGGRVLLSFLEDHNISFGERISAARTLGESGTEGQKEEMKVILSGLLESSEIPPDFSGYIRSILEGDTE